MAPSTSPLTSDQLRAYREEGYLHLPAVYTPAEVARARSLIAADIASGGWTDAPYASDGVTTDVYERVPALADVVFNAPYLAAVRQLFGGDEAVVLAEPAVHRGRYYSWHKDSTFLDEQGECFHWAPDFEAAMTVLYLQDNHPDFGGGITVVPGTQHDPDFYHAIPRMSLAERAWLKAQKLLARSHFDRLDRHPDIKAVPTVRGDLLVLDMRLDYKGTPAVREPPEEKFGIMNIACRGRATAERLRAALRRRPGRYYREYLAAQPATTPQLERKAREHGVTIRL